MALDWLQQFYRDNHINGLDGRLDEEGRQYWLKKAEENGIEQTKKDIEWSARNQNTWNRSDLKDWVQQYYDDNNIGGPGGDISFEARQYWLERGNEVGEGQAKGDIKYAAENNGTWDQGNSAQFTMLPVSAAGGSSSYDTNTRKFTARLYNVHNKTDHKSHLPIQRHCLPYHRHHRHFGP